MRLLIGSMFMAAGLFFVQLAWRNWRSMRRALPATGTVEDLAPGNETTVVTIRYRDAAGREHVGTTQPVEGVSLLIASPIRLRYDPRHPQWVMLEGDPVPYRLMLAAGALFWVLGGMILVTGIRLLMRDGADA